MVAVSWSSTLQSTCPRSAPRTAARLAAQRGATRRTKAADGVLGIVDASTLFKDVLMGFVAKWGFGWFAKPWLDREWEHLGVLHRLEGTPAQQRRLRAFKSCESITHCGVLKRICTSPRLFRRAWARAHLGPVSCFTLLG